MALTEGARKLLISNLQSSGSFAHPPGLTYQAVWPPYYQLRIAAWLSPSSCLCELSASTAGHHAASWGATHVVEAFSPHQRRWANEKERAFCTFEPRSFAPEDKAKGKVVALNVLHQGKDLFFFPSL